LAAAATTKWGCGGEGGCGGFDFERRRQMDALLHLVLHGEAESS